jgi:hypothetical protein
MRLVLSETLTIGIVRFAARMGISKVSSLIITETAPGVGIVCYNAFGGEQLPWLADALRNIGHEGPVDLLIAESWRGTTGSVISHLIDRRGRRLLIGKIAAAASPNPTSEADTLIRLASAARTAGALVPDVMGVCRIADRHICFLSVLEGQKAAHQVVGNPQRAIEILEMLSLWLRNWSVATKSSATVDERALTSELLDKASVLEKSNTITKTYMAWLAHACRTYSGMLLPRVASHNDLTTHNVLVHGTTLGVIDWEAGRENGLPLVDFEYAAVDLVAAIDKHRDRSRAWSECFTEGGRFYTLVAEHRQRLANHLGLEAGAAALCSHACWIGHAYSEQERDLSGSRPFGAILRKHSEQAVENAV